MQELFQKHTQDNSPPSHSGSSIRGGESSYSCNTRLARLDFPRFNGDGIKQWLIQCETFFSVDNTPEDYKVRLAVVHFEGKALQWHSAYVKTVGLENLPSWLEYTRILLDRFGEICEDPMADLMKLRQKSSITEYHEEFDSIVSHVELSEAHQLSCFLGGLKQDVQMMVRMFQPDSVRKVFSLAKIYEASTLSNPQFKPILKNQKPQFSSKPPILSNPSKPAESTPMKAKTFRNLSPAYMSEKRAKGLCYFCDEPFTAEHGLTHKKLQIHVMEIDDGESVDTSEDVDVENSPKDLIEPQISVHALTGIASFRTMRITGYYKKKTLAYPYRQW
uniref:Retrotransposon gag domain-containing protein n=1 Tax=Cajanus cajan TaxID=3821 RepID=A0A151R616_CAJCA|nr:hypothetical protein KK1_040968 [Cajanus cajan]